jgi:hypothetical protein
LEVGSNQPLEADDQRIEDEGGKSPADEFLDELMPPELEWRRIVRRHPIPSLLVAAGLGYWLGRSSRGTAIVEGLAGTVALGMARHVGDLGGDHEPAGDEDPLD